MHLLPMASSPDGLISARCAVITKTPGREVLTTTRNVNVTQGHGCQLTNGGGLAQGLGGWLCQAVAAPIGLSLLHILTLCGPERVLVVSTDGGLRAKCDPEKVHLGTLRPHFPVMSSKAQGRHS